MKQPPGFVHSAFSRHVYKLEKAIYGLKHAPGACFQSFSNFLLYHSFVSSHADPSMFISRTDSRILVLLLYVDNIILTGNSEVVLQRFIALLSHQFPMKDLGDLHYFLGIQVVRSLKGFFFFYSAEVCHLFTPQIPASNM